MPYGENRKQAAEEKRARIVRMWNAGACATDIARAVRCHVKYVAIATRHIRTPGTIRRPDLPLSVAVGIGGRRIRAHSPLDASDSL